MSQSNRSRSKLKFTPYQYLGILLLITLLTAASTSGAGRPPISYAQAQDVALSSPLPLPTPPPNLADLITLNRNAAAQVALLGLTPAEHRPSAAQSAASWMAQAAASLPQTNSYTAHQRALLDDWQLALTDYAGGQSGLARVRAVSRANAELYQLLLMENVEN